MITIRRVLLALATVALTACASRGQAAPGPSAPRSPDGQPAPAYPLALARAGVAGEVWLRVAVDSLGRPVPAELRVLRSTHELFARAARAAVLAWRFEPGAGSADVRVGFEFVTDRSRCDPEPPASDSALRPQWYRYDRTTAGAHVAVCPISVFVKDWSHS